MEVLFHFIFALVKISILGCVYATLTLLTIKVIGHFNPNSWFDRVSKNKRRLWVNCGRIISVGLFIFMFTYYGDHGLGDSSKVPVGHFKVVKYGGDSYLQNDKGDQLGIRKFTFDKDRLYAETQKISYEPYGEIVVWDLRTDEWTFYKTKYEYLNVTKDKNYPTPDNFEDFFEFYKRHWNGWRFWFLP